MGEDYEPWAEVTERPVDGHGRPLYEYREVPPQDVAFAVWRGRITHPTAFVSTAYPHEELGCVGGWAPSGSWWLHCPHHPPERSHG